MTDNKTLKNVNKILQNKFGNNNERDRFSTKTCRSAKKIAQLKRSIEKQRQRDVREMYIYHTKKYFVKLYKRYYMFNFINFTLKSAIK